MPDAVPEFYETLAAAFEAILGEPLPDQLAEAVKRLEAAFGARESDDA